VSQDPGVLENRRIQAISLDQARSRDRRFSEELIVDGFSTIDQTIATAFGTGEEEQRETRAKYPCPPGINASQTVGRVDRAEKSTLPRDGSPISSTNYVMIVSP